MERREDRAVAVEPAALVRFVAAVLGGVGVPAADGQRIAAVLVDRELCGYDDHGLPALSVLLRLYREGHLNPAPNVRVVQEGPAVALLDGDRGAGLLTGAVAMEHCVATARAQGFACAGVRNSGHFFTAGSSRRWRPTPG